MTSDSDITMTSLVCITDREGHSKGNRVSEEGRGEEG